MFHQSLSSGYFMARSKMYTAWTGLNLRSGFALFCFKIPSSIHKGLHIFSIFHVIHIAYSNYLFANILHLSCLFYSRIGVFLSALYSTCILILLKKTCILMNFLYPIFTFFIGMAIDLMLDAANHSATVVSLARHAFSFPLWLFLLLNHPPCQ